jgi:hypothetical protein
MPERFKVAHRNGTEQLLDGSTEVGPIHGADHVAQVVEFEPSDSIEAFGAEWSQKRLEAAMRMRGLEPPRGWLGSGG